MANIPQRPSAIVTGGGRGIGRAIARRLATVLPVLVVGRTELDLQSVCEEIIASGGEAAFCVGDISNPIVASQVIAVATAHGWWTTHLVCNAGVGKSGPTESFDPAVWRSVFETNVHGAFAFVQACLPEMIQHGTGNITFISSLAGVRGVPYDAAYTASKHALVGLARSLIAEFSKRGVRVAAHCPSFVESEMTERTIRGVMRRHDLSETEARRRVAEKTPSGRIVPAEEIAEVVALLGAGDIPAADQLAAAGGYPIITQPN